MEFTVYRDLASIAFVRCISPIPGTSICAEGTGFSIASAIAKCRSESIESQFHLSHPLRSNILGIAAHPDAAASEENAWNETLETLVLEHLARSPIFYGFSIPFFNAKLCLGRVNDRFIAIAFFNHRNVPTATQAVSKNPLIALVKTWSEVRNLRLYNPDPSSLPAYTKANRILNFSQLSNIKTTASFRSNDAANTNIKKNQIESENHLITYFIKEIKK